ncbi:ribonuclease H-like domain-containing protein [Tanacetum coccineum]|uniref:Ribonuclease H-like domain-containing protein n=1 Tax=Tanacetum coccineum TaxID=301880 RepID=A0ABQ5CC11_9ASTR
MDQDSTHMVAVSKVPMLKLGEFELWRMRIEQYIQVIDYALWEVIENDATMPKTQVVEEMLDQTFNRLQKLVSQLDLLDEKLSQEDVNQKLLYRACHLSGTQHACCGGIKVELETMSMNDLYNNLKVYGTRSQRMSSSSSNTQNMAFVSFQITTTLAALMKQLICSWSLLTASTQKVLKNIGRKLTVNDNETNKSKMKCYNCHKRGNFARECRAPRNQDNKKKESSKRSVPVKYLTSTLGVLCDASDKFENASKSLGKLIECQIVDNCKKGLGYEKYNAVPPPYTGNFMPPTPDLSFTGLDEFVNKLVVENRMTSEEEPKVVRKNDDAHLK